MSILDRLFGPAPLPAILPATIEKAEIGPGVAMLQFDAPLASFSRTPQKLMAEAQVLYHTNPWIHVAEATVTRRVVGLPWHLEDENDEEIPETSTGAAGTARQLLEKPQAALTGRRQMTRRELVALTSRHMGLCGMSYWYLDQMDRLAGTPLAIIYVNPARVWTAEDAAGNLTGWVLDAKDASGRGGTPLELNELLPFYLDPPDSGHYGRGLVEAAGLKAQITTLADRHAAFVLATGGRLGGIVSPREGTIPDEKFQALVREFRTLAEAPDAAKRTTILSGPVDFTATAMSPSALNLLELSKMNRDDILAVWGVPPTMGAIPAPAGLNSGGSREYDEATLMQGAVHDRIRSIQETIQYGLLDRWQKLGVTIELEIEEPEFDDQAPAYEIASKAVSVPLTVKERRELVGLDPIGDPAIDEAIYLPMNLVKVATTPEGPQEPAEAASPRPMPVPAGPAPAAPSEVPPEEEEQAKARRSISDRLAELRTRTEELTIPEMVAAVQRVLDEQKREIADRIAARAGHIAARPTDTAAWWNAQHWDERLRAELGPYLERIGELVTGQVSSTLSAGKADPDPTLELVLDYLRQAGAARVKGINETTRDKIRAALIQGIGDGLTSRELGDYVAGSAAFDPYRGELIARTEMMRAYNVSALETYRAAGIERVSPLDGDQDAMCIARLARGDVPIDVAMEDEDHPNGTLNWLPVLDSFEAHLARNIALEAAGKSTISTAVPIDQGAATLAQMLAAMTARPSGSVTVEVPAQPTPIVDSAPFAKALEELKAAIVQPRIVTKRVVRDPVTRQITEVIETHG